MTDKKKDIPHQLSFGVRGEARATIYLDEDDEDQLEDRAAAIRTSLDGCEFSVEIDGKRVMFSLEIDE